MLKSWNGKSVKTVTAEKNILADGENLLLTSSSVQNREYNVELIQALIHRGLWWVKSVINSMLNVYCIITKCVFLWSTFCTSTVIQEYFQFKWTSSLQFSRKFLATEKTTISLKISNLDFFFHKYERCFRRSLPDLRLTLFFLILPHLSTTESSKNWTFICWKFMNHFTPNI